MTIADKINDAFTAVGNDISSIITDLGDRPTEAELSAMGVRTFGAENSITNFDDLPVGWCVTSQDLLANSPDGNGSRWIVNTRRTGGVFYQMAKRRDTGQTYERSSATTPLDNWERVVHEDVLTDAIENMAAPTILRRRYIDVADYAPTSGTDWHSGIQAAFNDGHGKDIVFTNGTTGSRKYTLTDRSKGRLILPRYGRVIGADDTAIDATGWGTLGTPHPLFYGEGTYRTPISTATRPASGDVTIHLGITNLARAMSYMDEHKVSRWPCYLSSTVEYFTTEEGTLGLKGEPIWIVGETGEAGVAFLESPIIDDYTAGNSTVQVSQDLLDLTFDNLTMVGAGRLGDVANTTERDSIISPFDGQVVRTEDTNTFYKYSTGSGTWSTTTSVEGQVGDVGILLVNAVSAAVNGGSYDKFDKHGVHLINTHKFAIHDATFSIQQDPDFGRTQYPLAIANGCEHGLITGNTMRGGREGLSLTSSGTQKGVTRNVTIRDNSFRSHYRSGIALHDNHENVVITSNLFEDCEQFIDIRVAGRGTEVSHNRGFRAGGYTASLNCAVQLGSGAGNIKAHANVWHDVLRGWWMPASIAHEVPCGDISIDGDKITGDGCVRGVLLDYRGSALAGYATDADVLGKVSITNVDFELGGGSVIGVELNGKWTNPIITGRFTSEVATGRPVFLNGADNGGAGFGPSDPHINVSYTVNLNAGVFLNHTTGYAEVTEKGIGFPVKGHVFTSNEYFTVGSIAPNNKSVAFHTLTGVRLGDFVTCGPAAPNDGIVVSAEVSSNDTIRVTFTNVSSATINPVDGQVYFHVIKR